MKAWILAPIALAATTTAPFIPGANSEVHAAEPGLSAVRFRGPKPVLEDMAKEAAKVRWTESSFDAQGRLTLNAPENYSSDDFGRLLEALDPFKSKIDGLQMLGPKGGPIDENGIEQTDD